MWGSGVEGGGEVPFRFALRVRLALDHDCLVGPLPSFLAVEPSPADYFRTWTHLVPLLDAEGVGAFVAGEVYHAIPIVPIIENVFRELPAFRENGVLHFGNGHLLGFSRNDKGYTKRSAGSLDDDVFLSVVGANP